MSVMDKFLTAMKLSGDEDEYYDDDGFYDNEPVPEPQPRKETASRREVIEEDDIPEEKPRKSSSSVMRTIQGGRSARRPQAIAGGAMEICAIKPASMEDTREVTDTLLENRAVVLNLEGLDVDVAQRIVDFVSGSCYAIKGKLQKISRYIFIITPASVDISGDFQEMIGGSFGGETAGRTD